MNYIYSAEKICFINSLCDLHLKPQGIGRQLIKLNLCGL